MKSYFKPLLATFLVLFLTISLAAKTDGELPVIIISDPDSFFPGMYSYSNPGIIGGSNPSLYFYMNWGWGPASPYSGPLNGWYSSNNVSVDGRNFINDRKDIIVMAP